LVSFSIIPFFFFYCKSFLTQVFTSSDDADAAVKGMDGEKYADYKLRVELAGKPKKTKGPQPNDECRYCHKLGHW
jgi:nitrate/TMAO reductase-like tetraheme cytochrome c subunit